MVRRREIYRGFEIKASSQAVAKGYTATATVARLSSSKEVNVQSPPRVFSTAGADVRNLSA